MAKRFRCELVGADRVYDMCLELARQIASSRFNPQIVVAVSRGGFVPARYLCDFLGISALTSIKVQHYAAGARKEQRAWVRFPLSGCIEGQRVLIVDDVNDTGDTLVAALEHLGGFGAAQVRTAVLHEKLTTRTRADFRVCEVRDWHWIIYPWALVEDVSGFLDHMEPTVSTPAAAAAGLLAEYGIRMTTAQLEMVLSLRGAWRKD